MRHVLKMLLVYFFEEFLEQAEILDGSRNLFAALSNRIDDQTLLEHTAHQFCLAQSIYQFDTFTI